MKKFISFTLIAAFLALPLAIVGCGDTTLSSASSQTAFGKVIDSETRMGVAEATIYVKVKGEWKSTTTSAAGDTAAVAAHAKASTDAAETTAGDWKMDLPCGTFAGIVHPPATSTLLPSDVTVGGGDCYTIGTSNSKDNGLYVLYKGTAVTIDLVDADDGSAVTGAVIYQAVGGSTEDVMATETAGSYAITLPIMDGNQTLIIQPAADATTGLWTHQGAVELVDIGAQTDLTRTVTLNKLTDATALSVVATTLGGLNGMGAADAISVVYNRPISVPTVEETGVIMTFTDDFKTQITATASTLSAEKEVTVTATAVGSVLTVTPSAALTVNETYRLEGLVSSNTGPGELDLDLSPYVYMTGAGSIGSDPVVTLDNGNGKTTAATDAAPVVITTGDAGTTVTGNVVMVFPEAVSGTFRLVSQTVGDGDVATTTDTTILNGGVTTATGTTFYSVVDKKDLTGTATDSANTIGYNRAGGLYAVTNLGIGAKRDHTTLVASDAQQSYVIGIDVVDSEGNVYKEEKSYEVK